MLKQIPMIILIFASLILMAGCKEKPKQQAKQESQSAHIKLSPEDEAMNEKMQESRYKPSEKKEWKPF